MSRLQTKKTLGVLALALAFEVSGSLGRSFAGESDPGRELYIKYCGSCHGTAGKGDGPASPHLKVKPTDLTLLKKDNRGIYPLNRVMSSIDGTRSVRGHGDAKMPVWGEVFEKETESRKYPTLTSLLKVKVIAEYISTLQR